MAKKRKRSSPKPNGAPRRPARPNYTRLRTALEACAEHIESLSEIDRQVERLAATGSEREPSGDDD